MGTSPRKSSAAAPSAHPAPDGVLVLLGGFLLFTLAARLEATAWTEGLGLASGALLLGYGLGVLAGVTRWRWPFVAGLAVAYGTAVLPFWLAWYVDRYAPPDVRLLVLAWRLRRAWQAFAADRPVDDPVLFLALLVGVAWALGWWVGFAVTRRRGLWRVLLPPLLALWLIQAYDPYVEVRTVYVLVASALALLYLAWHTFGQRMREWRARRLLAPPDLGWDWARVALSAVFLMGVLAWSLPRWEASLPGLRETWQRVTRPWERIQRRLGRLVEPLQGPTVWEAVGYAERMPLGLGVPETDDLVFRVEAPRAALGERYYWRVQVYTTYRRGLWEVQKAASVNASGAVFPRPEGAEEAVDLRFVLAQPTLVLYTPLYPLRVLDVPYQVRGVPLDQGLVDPLALVAQAPLPPGSRYRVQAWRVPLTAEQLRQAGTDYPSWVALYLQVPEDTSARVRALAATLAQQADNPYDRARVVTAYLRDQITYRNPLPEPPPPGKDPVDWFLFEKREGFCTYYATAEVVLLRLMGIPARLAVGYAQGRYADGAYLVRGRDSHAWPEVYFPGVGWVPFEPTVARPALVRPGDPPATPALGADEGVLSPEEWLRRRRLALGAGATAGATPSPTGVPEASPPEGERAAQGLGWRWVLPLLAGLGGLALLAGGLWALQRPWVPHLLGMVARRVLRREPRWLRGWARWTRLGEVGRAFWELQVGLRLLGAAPAPGEGPQEQAERLARRLPLARDAVMEIAQAYLRLHFAPPEKAVVPLEPVRRARRRVRRAVWRAWRRRWREARRAWVKRWPWVPRNGGGT